MRCAVCNSAPRQRRIHYILNERIPNWKDLRVHEFAPFRDWVSSKAISYSSSQYYPDEVLGKTVGAFRNEDVEQLTFPDESIELFLIEDLLEHVFQPQRAIREMLRTLKTGGWILGTVPLEGWRGNTKARAILKDLGQVEYLEEKRFHGTPAGSHGSLVVWEYGVDFEDRMRAWVGNHSVEFFGGEMLKYMIKNDKRSTFLIRK